MLKLRVYNLEKKFKLHTQRGKTIKVLNSISFNLKQGEFLTIIGPSGVGKSTILKCIYRTYKPTSGEIILTKDNGENINLHSIEDDEILEIRKKELGYVSQFLRVLPRVSTLKLVAKPLLELGVAEKEARERAQELLLLLGIKESLHDLSPLTFSGGEQQRVNIARAIIAPKRLLLLDEPTASLDERRKKIVIDILKKLREKDKVTIIGIFHEFDLIKDVSDRFLKIGSFYNE